MMRWRIVACACASLLPFILLQGAFGKLFWFDDDWALLHEIAQSGFLRWLVMPYGEHFCPLFKLLWGGAAILTGNYRAMLAIVWLTHALNVVLLGVLLSRSGFGRVAVTLSLLVFGLASTNVETLGWSVQWASVLQISFFLVAALLMLDEPKPASLLALAAACLASALCFSRGLLTGIVIAAVCLLDLRRPATALAAAAPAIAAALATILISMPGGAGHILPRDPAIWSAIVRFAAAFWFLNPLERLVSPSLLFGVPGVLFGLVKVGLVAGALSASRGRVRTVLVLLTLFDMGNAALVALGRYWTTPPLALSSRYQYPSLLCVLPCAGFLLERLEQRIGRGFTTAAIVAATLLAARRWPDEMRGWSEWRGWASTRKLLESSSRDAALPNLPILPAEARDLMARYHLD